jgi:hypothetical protein
MGSFLEILDPLRIHSCKTLTTLTKRINSSETISASIFKMQIYGVVMTFQEAVNFELSTKGSLRVVIYVDLIKLVRMDCLFRLSNHVTNCLKPKTVSCLYHRSER